LNGQCWLVNPSKFFGGRENPYKWIFGMIGAGLGAFFSGDSEGAQRELQDLHRRARRPQDEAAIAAVEVYLLTVLGRLGQAVEVMRPALRRHGLDLPPHPAWEEVTRKYEVVRQAIGGRPIEALADLPLARDAATVALWTFDEHLSRAVTVGAASAVAAAAAWTIFHSARGARWYFAGGLLIGLLILAMR